MDMMSFERAKKLAIAKWERMVKNPMNTALGVGHCAFCDAHEGGITCRRDNCPLRDTDCAYEFARWWHFAELGNKVKAKYWAMRLLSRIKKSRKPINWPK